MNLKYSVPFSSKKYRETKKYDVNPIILPMFHDESNDGDQDAANDNSNQGNSEPDIDPSTVTGNDDNVVLSECVVFVKHYVDGTCVCVCMCVSVCAVCVSVSLCICVCVYALVCVYCNDTMI